MRRPQFAAAGDTRLNGSLLTPGADVARTGVEQGWKILSDYGEGVG